MFGLMNGSSVFDEIDRLHRELDRLFGDRRGASGIRSVAAGSFPEINVGVAPDRVDVYVFAAGLDAGKLDISLQQDLLTIAGERRLDDPQDAQVYRRERFNGAFRRVISLPEGLDADRAQARYADGVLQITLPRQAAVKPRRIEVQDGRQS